MLHGRADGSARASASPGRYLSAFEATLAAAVGAAQPPPPQLPSSFSDIITAVAVVQAGGSNCPSCLVLKNQAATIHILIHGKIQEVTGPIPCIVGEGLRPA